MTLAVHLGHQPSPEALDVLTGRLDPGVAVTVGPDLPDPAAFDVLVSGVPDAAHLDASPRLRRLVIPYAGVPEPTRNLLRERPGIDVHNLHHNARPTAETALALLLAAAKHIVPLDRAMRTDDWSDRGRARPSLLLTGRSVLVLGYGHVGRHAAALCRGIGMRVTGVQRGGARETTPEGDRVHPVDDLLKLLPTADALLICLPLTEDTHGLIGWRELDLLPEHAVLVNVGRGAIVDEEALHTALSEGSIGAAGIDVWYRYPKTPEQMTATPPSAFPFASLENVVMSPHRAGAWTESERLRMEHLADLLNAAARGDPVPCLVDVAAGY